MRNDFRPMSCSRFRALRELLAGHKEPATRLKELETRIERKPMNQDQAIAGILDAIRQLMAPPPAQKKRPVGFLTGEKQATRRRAAKHSLRCGSST